MDEAEVKGDGSEEAAAEEEEEDGEEGSEGSSEEDYDLAKTAVTLYISSGGLSILPVAA